VRGPATRRALVVWALLFAVYASTVGIRAQGASDYGGDEPHYLLIADSIVSDGDLDVADQYRTRAYADWYPGTLVPHGSPTDGRLDEPYAAGFALLIAPAYALGGPVAVELFLAALSALAFALAVGLARRLVPEPYATAAVVVAGLSPPALAYATAVSPEMAAAAALTGACSVALRVRDRPRMRTALLASALAALLPWLGTVEVLPGAIVALAVARWLGRRRGSVAGLMALEVMLFSIVLFVSLSARLYGGLAPEAAASPTSSPVLPDSLGGWLDRADRLVGLWVDRDVGLLRWAPFAALALWALWLLWRSRRERVARAVPARIEVEVAAALLALVCAAQVFVAVFLTGAMDGPWFPGRALVPVLPAGAALAAWGLRHAPRAGAALATLTLAASAWLVLELRLGTAGWADPPFRVPLGPLREALPRFAGPGPWPTVVALAVLAALLALAAQQWRSRRARRRPAMA
jgi:hypothetical protein